MKSEIRNLPAGRQGPKSEIIMIPLLLFLLIVFGCQLAVEKPSREGTGPMAIKIDVDEAPESHTDNITAEGMRLENPYSKIPVIGKLFKSSLKELDFWRANHPNLVTGTHNPALLADPDETCLDCHDQSTSCNNCHTYVGVKIVTGGEE